MREKLAQTAGDVTDRGSSAVLLAAATVALGYALQVSNGTLNPEALRLLTISLSLTLLAVMLPRIGSLERLQDEPALLVLAAGLVLEIAVHLTTPPAMYMRLHRDALVTHHYWVAAAAILAGAGLSRSAVLGWIRVLLLLVVFFALGTWLLHASPDPRIDVFYWHREALDVLARGQDPYAATMPNIYGHTLWYAQGLADNAHVFVGYPYPPLSLLVAWPGQLLGSDYRWSNLVALTLTGALMAWSRPGRIAPTAAAIFLFTPRMFFVLEQGWTEANAIFFLALTVFCACRFPRLLPVAFGLLLGAKQYFVLTAPLALLMLPRPLRWREVARFYLVAGAVAFVITAPFFLWDPKAFYASVVAFQAKQPFRTDALSFLAWAATARGATALPSWIPFAAVLPAYALALWRAPRTPSGFAMSTALVLLAFFATAKQAFANYYFLIVGALACAVAATRFVAPFRGVGRAPDSGAGSAGATAGTAAPTAPS